MPQAPFRFVRASWETCLLAFSVAIAAVCLVLLPPTPGPTHLETSEAVVPMAIAAALCLFAAQLRREGYAPGQLRRIVRDGWVGTLVAVSISGWWVAVHLYTGAPVAGLTDQILTVVGGGHGAGVLVGRSAIAAQRPDSTAQRRRVLAETVWTNREGPAPVLDAVVEVLADLDGVDPTEVDPLHAHVDPEIFEELRARGDSQWRYLFSTDSYEVGVSSRGTVSVYEPRQARAQSPAESLD